MKVGMEGMPMPPSVLQELQVLEKIGSSDCLIAEKILINLDLDKVQDLGYRHYSTVGDQYLLGNFSKFSREPFYTSTTYPNPQPQQVYGQYCQQSNPPRQSPALGVARTSETRPQEGVISAALGVVVSSGLRSPRMDIFRAQLLTRLRLRIQKSAMRVKKMPMSLPL